MSDDNQNEGVSDTDGAEVKSKTDVSKKSEKSFDGQDDVLKLLNDMRSELRGLQSKQDRSDKENREKFAEFARLKKSGMTDDEAYDELDRKKRQAEREAALDEIIAERRKGNGTPDKQPAPSINLDEFGLDKDDPKVSEILTSGKSEVEVQLSLAKYGIEYARKPKADASSASTPLGGSALAKMTEQVADQKYSELAKLMREPTVNSAKINQIKKDLSDAGYPL